MVRGARSITSFTDQKSVVEMLQTSQQTSPGNLPGLCGSCPRGARGFFCLLQRVPGSPLPRCRTAHARSPGSRAWSCCARTEVAPEITRAPLAHWQLVRSQLPVLTWAASIGPDATATVLQNADRVTPAVPPPGSRRPLSRLDGAPGEPSSINVQRANKKTDMPFPACRSRWVPGKAFQPFL